MHPITWPRRTRVSAAFAHGCRWMLLWLTFSLSGAHAAIEAPASHYPLPTGEYRFGVFPYLSPTRLETIYAPVIAALQETTEARLHFRTGKSFRRFFERLSDGDYDFALIQPFWYPPAVDKFGYRPLVRYEEPFTALIVVPDDSPLRTPEDLEGKIIATPPAFVPVVHMARQALIDRGLVPGRNVTLKAFKSVDSCVQQVLIGHADACVAPPFAPKAIARKLHITLRPLLVTPSIPNLTLVAHQRVPIALRRQVRDALLSWSSSDVQDSPLRDLPTAGFQVAHDRDYDPVRAFLKHIAEQQP